MCEIKFLSVEFSTVVTHWHPEVSDLEDLELGSFGVRNSQAVWMKSLMWFSSGLFMTAFLR